MGQKNEDASALNGLFDENEGDPPKKSRDKKKKIRLQPFCSAVYDHHFVSHHYLEFISFPVCKINGKHCESPEMNLTEMEF